MERDRGKRFQGPCVARSQQGRFGFPSSGSDGQFEGVLTDHVEKVTCHDCDGH